VHYKSLLWLGVGLRTTLNFPQSYKTARALAWQDVTHRWQAELVATSSTSSTWNIGPEQVSYSSAGNALAIALERWGGPSRFAAKLNDPHYYTSISDMRTLASAHGLAFFYRDISTPLRLAISEGAFEVLSRPSRGSDSRGGVPGETIAYEDIAIGGRARWCEFLRTTDPTQAEYKRLDQDHPKALTAYEPANVEAPYLPYWGASGITRAPDDVDRHFYRQEIQTGALSLLAQNHAVAPRGTWKGALKAVHYPLPWVDVAEPRYITRSLAHRTRWNEYGNAALPLALRPAGAAKVEQLAAGDATLAASGTAGHEVLFFDDRMLDLA
jgi:hypothetical protein